MIPWLDGAKIAKDILSIRFIRSMATRMALAFLDPMARVGVVSRFADFQPVLTLGVRRFGAHVHDIVVVNLNAPENATILAKSDMVVIATGANNAACVAKPGVECIEYRHNPDTGDIDRLMIPVVAHVTEPHGLLADGLPVTLARKEES